MLKIRRLFLVHLSNCIVIMSFNEFVYEQGIIGVTIGTITGFAISNLMNDVNKELIVKAMNYFNIANAGIISSVIEFVILMTIVYILYNAFLYPIFKNQIEIERKEAKEHKMWKNELLGEVKNMDVGNVYF